MGMLHNLRDYQISKSLTSLELANLLGIEVDKLVSWYDGDDKPDQDERYRILKLMDGNDIHTNIDLDN